MKSRIGVYTLLFSLGDCTNNGVTSKEKSFELFSKEYTVDEIVEIAEKENLNLEKCLLVEKMSERFDGYVRCYPVSILIKKQWGMAGGNFVYSSDSRYKDVTGMKYPISVHDRVE